MDRKGRLWVCENYTYSEKLVLPRGEIQTRSESQVSMMPEGLLQALKDEQASNLIRYLMSSEQVPLPQAAASK